MKDHPEIGRIRHSQWLQINQTMIDRFADVTLDRQFIHVDPVLAADTPFGGTIAHGFLTLSLLSVLYETAYAERDDFRMGVNYGLDRVRFICPVRAGQCVRGTFKLISVAEKNPGQFQQSHDVTIEIEGSEKPALAAVWLSQYFI